MERKRQHRIGVHGDHRGVPLEDTRSTWISSSRGTQRHRVLFEPEGAAPRVIWAMRGPMVFLWKVIHVFMRMYSMMSKDCETRLGNLKVPAER
ncbi:MAG: hypothetical protein JXA20_01010 [Spirochaetes bacterium]|nr:hypothetical protein [Spirochaetota bacterium]